MPPIEGPVTRRLYRETVRLRHADNLRRMTRAASEIEAEIRALEDRLAALREELAQSGPAEPESAEDPDRPLRILIADDEPDIRELLGTLIVTQADLELVGVASDTGEAVAQAREHKPDVAILDLSMPGGGGIQAAIEIVRDRPETKIVAFTAHDTADAQLDVMRAGATSFLVKGASSDEILRTIRQAVRY